MVFRHAAGRNFRSQAWPPTRMPAQCIAIDRFARRTSRAASVCGPAIQRHPNYRRRSRRPPDSHGMEVEFKRPGRIFRTSPKLEEVIALDAELCLQRRRTAVFRAFRLRQPLSVHTVESWQDSTGRKTGGILLEGVRPGHDADSLRTAWTQDTKPTLPDMAIPPITPTGIGEIRFRVPT